MTEKVKLTKKQAKGIEVMRKKWDNDESLIRTHASYPNAWVSGDAKNLNGMPLLTLVDALRIGYEVEPEFEPWQMVKYDKTGCGDYVFGLFSRYEGNRVYAYWDNDTVTDWMEAERVTPATSEEIKAEQERRVWAGIGREVGEFRGGDRYVYHNGVTAVVGVKNHRMTAKAAYESGQLKGFYPAESFIEFGGGEE